MSDQDLRTLERIARESPDDAHAWARYVRALALARAGAPPDLADKAARVLACLGGSLDHAMIRVGDQVWVEERESPLIIGRWRGIVRAVHFEPEPMSGRLALRFRVRPLALDDPVPEIAWRAGPRPEWLARGLELSPDDRLELIARPPAP